MAIRIYVGNLPYTVTNDDLAQLFTPYGQVGDATVVMDRDTGRSKGFGFVEMQDDAAARQAIADLHGRSMGDRTLNVSEARPREDRPRRGGGGSRW
jgi:cold-inducible RNA-binding protein